MTSSIFQYPLITYDVIDDVIEVGAPKTNMIWNRLIKTQIKVFFRGNRFTNKKVMTTCIIYDVIVISVYYANFKNCCKSQFLTDFNNSGWK